MIRDVYHLGMALNLRISKPGLKAFKQIGAYIKPTTRMIQIFGNAAKKARLDINTRELQLLLHGEMLSIDLDIETGYVILTLGKTNVLGLGFYSKGQVRSEITKKELRKNIIFFVGRGVE
jgi:NOL1/NOP2/fmu family ribosome biogenesis protein